MRCSLILSVLILGIALPECRAVVQKNGLRNGELPDISVGWRPGPDSMEPIELKGSRAGVGFECPIALKSQRCYWDKDIRLDLARKEVLELEVFFTDPEKVDAVTLHFKSGKGWYSASRPIGDLSPRVLMFRRDEFASEGEPGDWSGIERMRISVWRSRPGSSRLHVYSFLASVPSIIVLEGKGDLARNCKNLVENWLLSLGLSSRSVGQQEIDRSILKDRELVILPYNPGLSADCAGLLSDFVKGGGRLFVHYSDSPILAKAMNVEVGAFQQCPNLRPWTRFEFAGRREASFPAAVYQRATAVVPVYPRGGGRILAVWRNGVRGDDQPPALVQTRQGLWMTQIPKAHNYVAKRQMMAAAMIRLVPSEAPRIARNMIEFSGQVDSFRNPAQTLLALGKNLPQNREAATAGSRLRLAATAYRDAQECAAQERYEQALAEAIKLRNLLEEAYVIINKQELDGMKGVWDHHGTGLYPGDWKRTCALLKQSGINTIFVNMLNGGTAHYPSKMLSPSETMRALGDQVAACLTAAQEQGLAVHVWKVCWKLDGAPEEFIARMKSEGRLQIDSKGKTLNWLNPAHPANRSMAIESIGELIRNYSIDGIHLDYIRYNWRTPDCSDYTRQAFSKSIGTIISDWPAAIMPGGRLQGKYDRWRVGQISSFVAEVKRAINEIDADVELSAAVWGGYPECVETVCQDWPAWLRDDSVDFVVPMNYSDSIDHFRRLLTRQIRLPNAKGRIYPGIGVSSSQSSLAPSDVVEQINLGYEMGFPGYVLFDLDAELENVVLPLFGTP